MSSDLQLIAGLRSGDTRAFDQAYQAHRAALYGFLVRMTGRRALAEDLLQEVFLRLARHSRRLRADTDLRAWLFTVARNLCRSHHRRSALESRGRRAVVDEKAADGGDARTPFEELAGTQLELAIEKALQELSPPLREVLLLVVVERMEPAEAAGVLGIRDDALRQRLRRARVAVANSLGRSHDYRGQK